MAGSYASELGQVWKRFINQYFSRLPLKLRCLYSERLVQFVPDDARLNPQCGPVFILFSFKDILSLQIYPVYSTCQTLFQALGIHNEQK